MTAGPALRAEEIARIFPFHLTLDRDLRIVAHGPVIGRMVPQLQGRRFAELFTVLRPHVEPSAEAFARHAHTLFLLETHLEQQELVLKGQMCPLPDGLTVFLGSPWITSIKRLKEIGLSIKDFAIHDPISDYLFLLQAQSSTIEDASRFATELEAMNRMLEGRVSERTAAVAAASARLQQEVERRERTELELAHAQRLNSLGRLVAGAAHEFNNLLTPMLCLAESVRDELTEHGLRHDLEQVIEAGERAAELVANMLTFGRASASQRAAVRLPELVSGAVQLLRASVPSSIVIETRLPRGRDVLVSAEPTQVHQVLLNLGTNARHAIGDTGGTIVFSVDTVPVAEGTSASGQPLPPGTYARVAVADSGCGMDPATVERIFDPFFTTKGVGSGTGLGLSIVHGIVARHGGRIGVHSVPSRGTTFTIDLPLVDGMLGVDQPAQGSAPWPDA